MLSGSKVLKTDTDHTLAISISKVKKKGLESSSGQMVECILASGRLEMPMGQAGSSLEMVTSSKELLKMTNSMEMASISK